MIRLDHKVKWKNAVDQLYIGLLRWGITNDTSFAARLQHHKDGYFETPKEYIDGVCFNDGTWHIYNTCITKGKKVVTKIKCMNSNTFIRTVYGYICFLKVDGITDRREMLYYTIKFIRERIIIPEKLFEYNEVNKKFLESKIDLVLKSEVEDKFKDTRHYAFEPGITSRISRSDYTKLQKSTQKIYNDMMIEKFYDPSLTVEDNLTVMNKSGLDIKKSKLYSWLKDRK